jgi:hypothetical protein
MEADDLLCSRNARSRTPLVGRAQWKINQPPSLKRYRASLEGACISFDARSRGQPDHSLQTGENEEGGKEHGLAIPHARATRGLRRPSLIQARTDKNSQVWNYFPV